MQNQYNLLKPESLGYIASETVSEDFVFSLEGVDQEIIQSYINDGIIEINPSYNGNS